MARRPILCLDFDGVIHSYASGWQGADVIPDPPVPGALKFIAKTLNHGHFALTIYSSRSHQEGGIRAMQEWLQRNVEDLALGGQCPGWLSGWITQHTGDSPNPESARVAALALVGAIDWPTYKPPAAVILDDRAIPFRGGFPILCDLMAFRPWWQKEAS